MPSVCVCVQLQSLQEEQQELEQTVQQYDMELCAAAEDLLQLQQEVAYAKAHAESLRLRVTPLQDVFEEIIQVTVQSPSLFLLAYVWYQFTQNVLYYFWSCEEGKAFN